MTEREVITELAFFYHITTILRGWTGGRGYGDKGGGGRG